MRNIYLVLLLAISFNCKAQLLTANDMITLASYTDSASYYQYITTKDFIFKSSINMEDSTGQETYYYNYYCKSFNDSVNCAEVACSFGLSPQFSSMWIKPPKEEYENILQQFKAAGFKPSTIPQRIDTVFDFTYTYYENKKLGMVMVFRTSNESIEKNWPHPYFFEVIKTENFDPLFLY